MKKFLALLLVLAMVLSLAACGNKEDNTPAKESDPTVGQIQGEETEATEAPVSSGEITMAALMAAPESPAEDFDVVDYGSAGIYLEGYLGDDEIVVIPESLGITHIAQYAFANNCSVKAIRFSSTIEVLEFGAVGACEALQLVVCGEGLRELGESAFQNCYDLREIVLNDGLVKLDAYALSGSDCLMSVEIPASVTDIHYATFYAAAEGFTIIGEAGSYAEQFAAEKDIPFEAK